MMKRSSSISLTEQFSEINVFFCMRLKFLAKNTHTMKNKYYLLLALISLVCFWSACQISQAEAETGDRPPSAAEQRFTQYCSGCHGAQMQMFVDRKWKHGKELDSIMASIKHGYADMGMPAFDSTFTEEEIQELALYIVDGIENMDIYISEEDKPESNIFPTESDFALRVDTIATGLEIPWGIAFLPDGGMLINDRNGKMYRMNEEGEKKEVANVPEVKFKGQGGLLDVELHPDFQENSVIYFTYSKIINDTLATTAIHRATLDGYTLTDGEDIFQAAPASTKSHHYGSRLEFDKDGYLFFTVGDRGARDVNPQNLDNHCGKVHRIMDDGSIPEDNPFANTEGAMGSIWSYGHRNPQGLAMHPTTGQIWEHEHGPRGGDELNLIEKALNYGWPVISYGINYDGTTFTQITEKEGMEQPVTYWVPSIAACGMTFINSDKYPGWENFILVGSLRYNYLNLCKMEGNKVASEEILMKNVGRMRTVEMGPDGYFYFGVEDPGMVMRAVPIPLDES